MNPYRPLLQTEVIAQGGHATDMHAGNRSSAEVNRDSIGLFMVQGGDEAFPA
jgi:hypothetical protein